MGYYYPKDMTYDEMETEAAKLIARMIMLEDDEEEAELQKEKENKAASEVASVLNEKQQINPNDGNASEDIQTIQK